MNLDTELQGIVRENEGDLFVFARKLYEHGYRQGLAARPQGADEPVMPSPARAAPPQPPAHLPLFPSRPRTLDVPDENRDEVDSPFDEEAPTGEEEVATCDHRVRGSITIAGLQRKIERLFDLDRFDIEVVICRRGDPDRRRLKGSVRLKNYLRETA